MTGAKQDGYGASGGGAVERLTPDMIAARLATLATGQAAMNGALGLMLDTLHVQTNLLRKLSELASESPAPSPIVKVLGELASAVTDMDASIGSLEERFGQLSGTIADAFDIKVDKVAPLASDDRAD